MAAAAATTFWGSPAALGLAVGLVVTAAFLLGVMLFGTAARKRQQRIIGERMAAVGNRGRSSAKIPIDKGSGGWIPSRVTSFGRRFADSRGFSSRLDAELEAANVSLRSGEFVIVTVASSFAGLILGYLILGSVWLAVGIGAAAGWRPDDSLFGSRSTAGRRSCANSCPMS